MTFVHEVVVALPLPWAEHAEQHVRSGASAFQPLLSAGQHREPARGSTAFSLYFLR